MKTGWFGMGFGIALILFGAMPYLLFKKTTRYSYDRKMWGMTDKTFDRLVAAFATLGGIILIILGVPGQ